MLELSKHILQALYETTGHTGTPVDIMDTLRRRWPAVSPDDVHAHLNSLAARGLVLVRADGAGVITTRGVEALAGLWQGGAFGVPGQQQAIALAAEAAMREAPIADSTQPYSIEEYRQVARETATARTSAPPAALPQLPQPQASDIDFDIEEDGAPSSPPPRQKSAIEEWSTARPTPAPGPPQGSAPRQAPLPAAVPVRSAPTPAPLPPSVPARAAPTPAPLTPTAPPRLSGPSPESARNSVGMTSANPHPRDQLPTTRDLPPPPRSEPVRTEAPLSWPPPKAAPPTSRPSAELPRSSVPAPASWGAPPPSSPPAPAARSSLIEPVALNDLASEARLNRLRTELDGLTQALSAATTLPMEEWTQAIELTSELERTLESLTEVLRRAIGQTEEP